MKIHRLRPWIAFTGLALLIGVLSIEPTRSQTGTDAMQIAVASVQNQHSHALGFRTTDLNDLIASLNSADDAVIFESSSGFDGGVQNGISHSHAVRLTKTLLEQLRDNGTVSVESESALNHTHTFVFYQQADCAAMASAPAAGGGGGPSARPSASARPSPSLSPSPSPSPSPSVSPSGTPSATPSGTPTGGSAPTPTPTFSIPPINIPTIPFPFVR